MNYDYKVFDNFEDFKNSNPTIAKKLLADVRREGDWMAGEVYFYPSIVDYAQFELFEGWYDIYDFDSDYRGAPNPIDFIDFEAFGKALINTWDGRVYWTDGEVVVSYGW